MQTRFKNYYYRLKGSNLHRLHVQLVIESFLCIHKYQHLTQSRKLISSCLPGTEGEVGDLYDASCDKIIVRFYLNPRNTIVTILYCAHITQILTLAGPTHFLRISKIMTRQTRNVSLWSFVC